ncbi:MAG: hypothetical protein RBR53_03160 [Desulforegulaceae bacterium]|nr:hypothetical protein [Desulforegulaceae bacterium]
MSLELVDINEENASENVRKVPGGVYLCQNDYLSCGACCGIYNFYYNSFKDFFEVILERTLSFDKVEREMESVLNFGVKETQRIEKLGKKPFPKFHHCPFAGFMDSNYEKPGCLLHPLSEKNKGIDFRGLSYYGGLACASYFCPTYYNVSAKRKAVLRSAVEDSYSYGLLVTEDKMINSVFDLIEKKRGANLLPHELNDEALIKLEKIFKLKLDWPFKTKNNHPANYFFGDKENEQGSLVLESSEVAEILKSAKAEIFTKKDIIDAETFINKEITEFISLL